MESNSRKLPAPKMSDIFSRKKLGSPLLPPFTPAHDVPDNQPPGHLKKNDVWVGEFPSAGRSSFSRLPKAVLKAEHLYHRGNEQLAGGAIEKAIISYQKAVRLNPRHAFAHTNIGGALLRIGRHEDAERHLKTAVALHPQLFEAHNNLGSNFYRQGRLLEAEFSYRRVIDIKPDYVDAYSNLSATLKAQGRISEAESSLRRSLAIKPDYADAHHNLGSLLTELGRFEEAEACFRQALQINPCHVEALVAMGHIVSHRGQFDEAETFFRRALSFAPKMSSAWAAIVGLRTMTQDDAAWLTTAEEIARSGLTFLREATLRFSMGKYCDDVKDFDRAFLNYQRANELLKTATKKYERQQLASFFDCTMRVNDRKQACHIQAGASASKQPVFIVGMMRSGTSLVEQILASHRAVFGAGELSFWSDAFRRHEKKILEATLAETDLKELADDYLRLLSGLSPDAERVVDKAPVNFTYLGLIHSVFPNARFIHMRRNPIDTCLSIYFQNLSPAFNFANDLADLAHYYREYHRLMEHWRKVLPSEVLLDTPYESLVGDQEIWSRKIIEFVGLDWDGRCLDFHKTERRVGTSSSWQVRQKMYACSVERWRNYQKHVGPLIELLDLH